MRIQIAAIGRMKQGPERELVARYLDRAIATGKSLSLTGFDVSEFAESRASSAPARKAEEAKVLRAALPESPLLIVLDEHGKSMGSESFAQDIGRWRDAGRQALSFVIGGPDGLDPSLLSEAALVLSFSPLTWPHQMVRMMLAEQLYRATTILSGHPYHRGES
jgi:23S rRNA (pseudouridine1915-N3)-methyltransferase